MKKIFSIIICLVLILMISLLSVHNKKDEDKSLTKIKVAEVTHSVFYAPWYVAIENNYFNIFSYWFLLSSAKDTYSEIYTEGQGVYPQKSTGFNEYGVASYPTLYLKSSVSISSGEGTSKSPYQLKLN